MCPSSGLCLVWCVKDPIPLVMMQGSSSVLCRWKCLVQTLTVICKEIASSTYTAVSVKWGYWWCLVLGKVVTFIYSRAFVHCSEIKHKHFPRNFLLQPEELKCEDSRIIFVILIQPLCACAVWDIYIFKLCCFSLLRDSCFAHPTCQMKLSKCDGILFWVWFFFLIFCITML